MKPSAKAGKSTLLNALVGLRRTDAGRVSIDGLDPATLDGSVAGKHVIDARNALDPDRWRNAGWSYRALGRPTA